MKGIHFILASALLVFISAASAFDPSPLQDFCVAVNNINNGVFVNGKFCKDPKLATADDFFFSGFNMPRNTSNQVGSNVTLLNADKIPGLNTLGISVARLEFAPGGLNAPHTHAHATEILTVLEGTLCVGFITSNQDGNRFFTKILNLGDVFVFPIGLIHFQYNVGSTKSVAIASLNSQNPGLILTGNTVFGAKPPINADVLTKAFQLDKNVVHHLQNQFWVNNH